MEDNLKNLYSLQQVDNALDELEELKGDLPAEKQEIETKLDELKSRRSTLQQIMKGSFTEREETDNEILSLKEKLERYKAQQLDVRTNREYDALTREMEFASTSIEKLEKAMEALEGKAVTAKADIETITIEIEETEKILQEKDAALAEISKTNEEEELKYRHERDKLVARIDKASLGAYERIRKAKKGRAVVAVRRGGCGGCFAKVPPQIVLELRQMKRVYHCEHCGRILVSEEIAEATAA